MRDGVPKGFDGLAADKGGAAFVERSGDDDGQALAAGLKILFDGEQAGFEIERVDYRFGQEQIDAGLDEGGDLLVIRIDHLVEGDSPPGWVFDLRGDRS